MNKIVKSLAFSLTIGMAANTFIQIQSAAAAPVLAEPEYIVEDQNGLVLGGLSRISFKGQVLVAMSNTTDNEILGSGFTRNNAVIPANSLIGEQLEVWYSGGGCTGTAYIKDPANAGIEAALRGATYAIGRKAGATNEDSIVLRGTGTGSDNSANMSSKFKASEFASTPLCTETQSTTVSTVIATQVADLSNFVRPFKYR